MTAQPKMPVTEAEQRHEAMRLLKEVVGPHIARTASQRGYKGEGVELFLKGQYRTAIAVLEQEARGVGEAWPWVQMLGGIARVLVYHDAVPFRGERGAFQKRGDWGGMAWAFLAEGLADIVGRDWRPLSTNLAGAAYYAKKAGASGKEVLAILQRLKELELEVEGL